MIKFTYLQQKKTTKTKESHEEEMHRESRRERREIKMKTTAGERFVTRQEKSKHSG